MFNKKIKVALKNKSIYDLLNGDFDRVVVMICNEKECIQKVYNYKGIYKESCSRGGTVIDKFYFKKSQEFRCHANMYSGEHILICQTFQIFQNQSYINTIIRDKPMSFKLDSLLITGQRNGVKIEQHL